MRPLGTTFWKMGKRYREDHKKAEAVYCKNAGNLGYKKNNPQTTAYVWEIRKDPTLQRIRIFGDSILKGVIYNKSCNQYSVLENPPILGLSQTYGLDIHNSSMFGSTVSKGIKLLQRAINRGLSCEIALVEYGGNDCDYPWAEIAENPTGEFSPNTLLDVTSHWLDTIFKSHLQKWGEQGCDSQLVERRHTSNSSFPRALFPNNQFYSETNRNSPYRRPQCIPSTSRLCLHNLWRWYPSDSGGTSLDCFKLCWLFGTASHVRTNTRIGRVASRQCVLKMTIIGNRYKSLRIAWEKKILNLNDFDHSCNNFAKSLIETF